MRQFYMRWREDFDDQEGWFTKDELDAQVQRIKALGDEGEAGIDLIIQGKLVTSSEKLVRDCMPQLCKTTPGWSPMTYRNASQSELVELLANKLVEESYEALAEFEHFNRKPFDRSKTKLTEELADVKEVLEALSIVLDIYEEVKVVQDRKFDHRGGFFNGVVWDGKK